MMLNRFGGIMKKAIAIFLLLLAVVCLLAEEAPVEVYDWSGAKKIAPGIKMRKFTLKSPRAVKLYAIKIDLADPRIYLITNPRDKDWGEFMPPPKVKSKYKPMKIQTLRMQVGEFARQQCKNGHDLRLAVNASPWSPWGIPIDHRYAGRIGFMVSDGVVVALPEKKRTVPALIIRDNGKADMINFSYGDNPDGIKLALSGFSFVLRDGKVCIKDKSLHPRTFYGLSADRKQLYILVADGRQKNFSEGMNCTEGGEFMKYLGASDAINMDGGGSTTLVTCRDGKVELINSPSDAKNAKKKDKLKHTRHVANTLGVCLRKR